MPDKVKTKAAWDNESNSKKRGNMTSEEKNNDVKTRPYCATHKSDQGDRQASRINPAIQKRKPISDSE